jgi:transposase
VNDFAELKREGLSIQAISSLTGFDRKTVHKDICGSRMGYRRTDRRRRANRTGSSGIWKSGRANEGRGVERGGPAAGVAAAGYRGSFMILKDWLQPQREAAGAVAVRRFETPPGRQAQVDWGHLGSLERDSLKRPLWGFTFTLG